MYAKKTKLRTRATLFGVVLLALMTISGTAFASGRTIDGPDLAIWLSDPDGVDGDNGIEQGDTIEGAGGTVIVSDDGMKVKIRATGLVPGHVYTLWVAYFNDSSKCIDGCNGPDFAAAGGGVLGLAGRIGGGNGQATLIGHLENGAGADYVGSPPPPPFAFAPYDPGPNNEFHLVIKSHGPRIPGLVHDQLTTYGGGCEVNVGPFPGQVGDFPVPSAPGECGEIQLYVFE